VNEISGTQAVLELIGPPSSLLSYGGDWSPCLRWVGTSSVHVGYGKPAAQPWPVARRRRGGRLAPTWATLTVMILAAAVVLGGGATLRDAT
jgi:hypothetical protein